MIIYKATNKINGMIYIGKTIQNLKRRMACHKYNSKNFIQNIYFHNALRKYRWENFTWEIIFECLNYKELNAMEKFFIAHYRTTNELYNQTDGGEGVLNPSEAIRKKMSIISKGRHAGENNYFYGKHLVPWNKGKKHLSGKDNPMYGKHHTKESIKKMKEARAKQIITEETRKKMSETHKRIGTKPPIHNGMLNRHHTEEAKRKLSENHKGKQMGIDNPFYSKKHSEESKKKMSMSHKKYYENRKVTNR